MIFLNLSCYNAPTELFLAHMQVSVTRPIRVSVNFIASQMVGFLSSWQEVYPKVLGRKERLEFGRT